MKPQLKTIAGQPSWTIAVEDVELSLTRLGGHMAPVTFHRGTKNAVQPYQITPWQEEKPKVAAPVLAPLRGDFFCVPFGGGSDGRKTYACHGDPAGAAWTLVDACQAKDMAQLRLAMDCADSKGRVTKTMTLVKGHNVVYSSHLLEGFKGRFPLGHHATLAMPEKQGVAKLSTSPIAFGLTFPTPSGNPAEGEYYSLQPGQKFQNLSKVPTIFKEPSYEDCTFYPRAKGYCDILGVFAKPGLKTPAWTALAFPEAGYVWFSLKDPAAMPALTIWSENHGRWQSPWSGRNSCLGLEDGIAYMATGMGPSIAVNPVSKAGIPTAMELTPKKAVAVNYIQGVFRIAKGFKSVVDAKFQKACVAFTGENGQTVAVPVQHDFLMTGEVK